MIVLSVGMIKTGSAWYFNLTNDLLVASGYQDARVIKQKFQLQATLKGQGCRLQGTFLQKMRVLLPHFSGNKFAIKVHGPPNLSQRLLIETGIAKATYIYRDPRFQGLLLTLATENLRCSFQEKSFPT